MYLYQCLQALQPYIVIKLLLFDCNIFETRYNILSYLVLLGLNLSFYVNHNIDHYLHLYIEKKT